MSFSTQSVDNFFSKQKQNKTKRRRIQSGWSLCPMASATGHIAMRTHVQDWKRVRRLTGPVAIGHWTQAGPIQSILLSIDQRKNHLHFKILSRSP